MSPFKRIVRRGMRRRKNAEKGAHPLTFINLLSRCSIDPTQRRIPNLSRQIVLQIQQTSLTNILNSRTGRTDLSLLKPCSRSRVPAENRKRSGTHFTFTTVFLLGHPNVRIVTETGFTEDWKVRGLLSGFVDIGFGRHGGDDLCEDRGWGVQVSMNYPRWSEWRFSIGDTINPVKQPRPDVI